jgi:hypothetical protein
VEGFPWTKAELKPYWRVRDMLREYEGVVGYSGIRTQGTQEQALDTLHAAHQGTTSMRLRAERNLVWPNMSRDIASKRMSCLTCDETATSQSPEPPITPITQKYPFQYVRSDFFSLKDHNFSLVLDRFSNWLQVYTGKGGAHNLISLLDQSFHSFHSFGLCWYLTNILNSLIFPRRPTQKLMRLLLKSKLNFNLQGVSHCDGDKGGG